MTTGAKVAIFLAGVSIGALLYLVLGFATGVLR